MNKLNHKLETLLKNQRLIGSLWAVFVFVFFLEFYPYHLYFREQTQLFQNNSAYFLSFLSKPAFLSEYINQFLAQFFFIRLGGPAIIAVLSYLIFEAVLQLLNKLFSQKANAIQALMPSLAVFILLLNTNFNYAFAISFLLSLFIALVYLKIPDSKYKMAIIILSFPLLYWIIGSGFYLPAFVIVYSELRLLRKSQPYIRIAGVILISLVVILIPVLFRVYFLLSLPQAYLYPVYLVWPQILWMLMPFLIIFLYLIINYFFKNKILRYLNISHTVLALVVVLVGYTKNVEYKIEKLLALDSEMYFGNYGRAKQLADEYKLESTVGAYFHNLINAHLGLLADDFLEVNQTGPQGLFLQVDNRQNYMTILFSNELYYFLGDVNGSQHSALLGMIFAPNEYTSRLLRRLVHINIINGEYALAQKYIDLLKQTLFHREWAARMEQYLYNEELCNNTLWISQKRKLVPDSKILRRPNDFEKSMHLLLDKCDNENALNYLLCYYLLNKDIESFARLYFTSNAQKINRIPQVYQQALLIYYINNQHLEIWRNLNIDKNVMVNFEKYTQVFEENRGRGDNLMPEFGNTYWFYYHYANVQIR